MILSPSPRFLSLSLSLSLLPHHPQDPLGWDWEENSVGGDFLDKQEEWT